MPEAWTNCTYLKLLKILSKRDCQQFGKLSPLFNEEIGALFNEEIGAPDPYINGEVRYIMYRKLRHILAFERPSNEERPFWRLTNEACLSTTHALRGGGTVRKILSHINFTH